MSGISRPNEVSSRDFGLLHVSNPDVASLDLSEMPSMEPGNTAPPPSRGKKMAAMMNKMWEGVKNKAADLFNGATVGMFKSPRASLMMDPGTFELPRFPSVDPNNLAASFPEGSKIPELFGEYAHFLSDEEVALIKMSPTLMKGLEAMADAGWKIGIGEDYPPGEQDVAILMRQKVVQMKYGEDSGQLLPDLAMLVGKVEGLKHMDTSNKDAYIKGMLLVEATSAFTSLVINSEILGMTSRELGKPADIGHSEHCTLQGDCAEAFYEWTNANYQNEGPNTQPIAGTDEREVVSGAFDTLEFDKITDDKKTNMIFKFGLIAFNTDAGRALGQKFSDQFEQLFPNRPDRADSTDEFDAAMGAMGEVDPEQAAANQRMNDLHDRYGSVSTLGEVDTGILQPTATENALTAAEVFRDYPGVLALFDNHLDDIDPAVFLTMTKSPTLMGQLEVLANDNNKEWKIRITSAADQAGVDVNTEGGFISIGAENANQAEFLIPALAGALGKFFSEVEPQYTEGREGFIESNLYIEAEGMFNSLIIRAELLDAGERDIPNLGLGSEQYWDLFFTNAGDLSEVDSIRADTIPELAGMIAELDPHVATSYGTEFDREMDVLNPS